MSVYCLSELTILYVMNDVQTQNYYENILNKYVKNVIIATDGSNGISLYEEYEPDIIITDIILPHLNGLEMSKVIKKINPYQPIIIQTEQTQSELILEAFDLDIDGYLQKSDGEDKLISKIDYIAHKWYMRNKNIEKREILQNILDHQSALTVLTDFKTISYSSKSFLDFFNIVDKNEFFNRHDSVLDMFMKHDDFLHAPNKDKFLSTYKEAKAIKKVVLLLSSDITPKAFHLYIDKVKDSDLYIISLSNISISQEVNVEMSHKAYMDGLTGVNNRNRFEEFFSNEFSKFGREKDSFCISILDIDHFKRFNDTYGHLIGDEVLIMLANEINNNVRKTDLFARWGGEEFVLLMSKTTVDTAQTICENLRIIIEKIEHKTAGKVTCSFGVTQVSQNDSLEGIFKRCDRALYNAKENGRNQVCIL